MSYHPCNIYNSNFGNELKDDFLKSGVLGHLGEDITIKYQLFYISIKMHFQSFCYNLVFLLSSLS